MAGSPSLGLADQSILSPGRQSSYLRVHAVNVFVRDQDRSLRFYLDQLGFTLAFDVRLQSGQRWVGVAPPDGTAVLTLIAILLACILLVISPALRTALGVIALLVLLLALSL